MMSLMMWIVIGIPIAIAFGYWVQAKYVRETRKEKYIPPVGNVSWRHWVNSAGAFCSLWVIATIVIKVIPYAEKGLVRLLRFLGLEMAQLLVSATVIAFGIVAFRFKKWSQGAYGRVEVLFGALAAIITARQMKPTGDWATAIASLVGCVYIVSRGLNNVSDSKSIRTLNEALAEAKSARISSSTTPSTNP